GSLFLLIALFNGSKKVYWGSWGLLLLAFTFHTLGFLLRIYIVGRPPVSNMYETVVWVPWGAMVFAFIMEIKNKNRIILLMASLSAMLCLILTNVAPTVLDASLHPLEPVLRSTFWLTTHVLMITISYGAFLLAWGLGNLILVLTLLGENKNKKMIKESAKAIYGALKIGAVLLAGGIILGGVWADYSWGRFWGWDPKETWALIALLGYLAILHAKIVGWVRDFGLGVTAVVAFSLVIMAWYGVNFILGAGLHAYGFGTGGVEYVVGATVLELLFALYVVIVRQGSLKKG
ncbi:MAG: cytochrome c biogenesis protein CcsA, partial [Bdellovibrionales bacterium]|nr:cytochrome c biogenesis protein CcsA [Bdellovibrionales bacterium]